jgi:inosose dehydratase
VVDGSQTYNEGVKAAMYTPLGEGDVDVKAIVTALVNSGYDGWFVLEQDLMLDGEPEAGGWPFTDAKKSVDYLRAVAASLN